MKKVLSLIVACLIIGLGIYFVYQGLQKSINVIDILPEGTVAYGHIVDLDGKINAIKESPLWTQLTSIDTKEIFEELEFKPEQILLYEKILTDTFSPQTETVFRKFFGQEITLAFFPPLENDSTFHTLKILINPNKPTRPRLLI